MPPKSKQTQTRTQTQLFKQPFPHKLITNFLSPEVYKKTFQIYNKLQFKQKQTDLFNFFQTDQLNSYTKLNYFKDELDTVFWALPPMSSKDNKIKKQQTFYNIFASYYFKGHYLLCHDDIVQDRLYAFSYYLQDHDSGDLVLFNQTADKQAKRIKVRKNTLAIFQVSDVSYHQVDYTAVDGRKAITGWFNVKGLGSKRKEKTITPYIPKLPQGQNVIEYPLPAAYVTEEYFQMMDLQYQFNIQKTWVEGPFFSRRVHKIQIDPPVVFTLPNYKLYSAQFYSFKVGDYILLNDPVNTIKGKDIIDIFVTHLSEGFVPSEEEDGDMLIKIAQPNEQTNGIPEVHDSLFVVKRDKKQYYVDRVKEGKEFNLAHFIYVKDDPKSSKKAKAVAPKKLKQAVKSLKKTPAPKAKQSKVKIPVKASKPAKSLRKNQTEKVDPASIQQKSQNTRKIKKASK